MTTSLLFIAQAGFTILTLVYFTLLVRLLFKGIHRMGWEQSRKKRFQNSIIIALTAWAGFTAFWSLSGIMGDFTKFPFNLMPVLFIPLLTALIVTFSARVTEVLQQIPAHHIIHLQSFRFFVELLLWTLFVANIIPVQMSFEGMNYDIFAGLTAPIVGWLLWKGKISRPLLILWNVICMGLLINIVTIAIVSTPTPLRVFTNEPANTVVTTFPVSLLPAFLVPLAYTLHFFSLRQLLSRKKVPAIPGNLPVA